MANEVTRMRYFNGLFLKEEEFNLEQNYHIRMRRLHNLHFHGEGIVWGLEVTPGSSNQTVIVNPGMALKKVKSANGEGNENVCQEIVLPNDSNDNKVDLTGDDNVYLYICCVPTEADPDLERGGGKNIHWVEKPFIKYSKDKNAISDDKGIILAKIVKTGGIVDSSSIKYEEGGVSLRTYAGFYGKGGETEKLTLAIEGVTSGLPSIEGKTINEKHGIQVKSPQTNFTGGPLTVDDNAGIGTARPGSKLDVYGAIRASESSANYLKMWYGDSAGRISTVGTGDLVLDAVNGAGVNLGGTAYVERGGVQGKWVMTVKTNGNVGIGTNNPQARLDICSSDAAGIRFSTTDPAVVNEIKTVANTPHEIVYTTKGSHSFIIDSDKSDPPIGDAFNVWRGSISGTPLLRVRSDGNVGIGTITPVAKLDITGDLKASGKADIGGDSTIAGNLTVQGTAAITKDLTVTGNFTVKGTTTTINTKTLEIVDNIVRVNKYDPQPAPQNINAGLEVFRGGTAKNAQIIWDESTGKWKIGLEGDLKDIPYSAQLDKLTSNAVVDDLHGHSRLVWIANDGSVKPALSVNENGNVGLGTTSPNAALQINGALSRQGTKLCGTKNNTHVNLGIDSTTGAEGSDIAYATVSGGAKNTASGNSSTVSGGGTNTASGIFSTVSGGGNNTASGNYSTVSGYSNTASGNCSTMAGGATNTASGVNATVSGGGINTARGDSSTVSGGDHNSASGSGSTVSGGFTNTASGISSTVSGGQQNIAGGDYSWAGGCNMQLDAKSQRTFVWGYSTIPVTISSPDAFIIHSGNVGVGMTNPSYKLDVNGVIRGSNVTPSDIRLKENIELIDNALEKVSQLRGVYFNWKDKASGENRNIGLIAQEVEKTFPEVVSEDQKGYKSINYGEIVAALVEAVKELKAQNSELEAKNKDLWTRIDALERKG